MSIQMAPERRIDQFSGPGYTEGEDQRVLVKYRWDSGRVCDVKRFGFTECFGMDLKMGAS